MSREEQLAATFVELADTLVQDFDQDVFLQRLTARCTELLEATEAVVLLARPGPSLYCPVPRASAPALQRVIEAACLEGPAVQACQSRHAVAPDHQTFDQGPARWPTLDLACAQAGYAPPGAVPMRLREEEIGALLLLRTGERARPAAGELLLAQALADAATIGLLHARARSEHETVNTQLHTALHSRVLIEQAKGIVATRHNISVNDAFDAIRSHARRRQEPINTTASEVIDSGLLPPVPAAHFGQNAEPGSERPG
ncbi:ANTAR domain-containing protein [Streptomyces sp. NPDC016845]|uniref:ANTAR domain-containing protein n=1 Tax=Streptomyces sp. NPDC016845 TaxID=3364972 RepID=UPI00379BEAE8